MRRFLLAAAVALAPATAFAWPVNAAGTVEVVAPAIPVPAAIDLTLMRNGTGMATVSVAALGVSQRVPVTWSRSPAGVVSITIPRTAVLSGVPSQGCITGQGTQPTPAWLSALVPTPNVTLAWDVCAAP